MNIISRNVILNNNSDNLSPLLDDSVIFHLKHNNSVFSSKLVYSNISGEKKESLINPRSTYHCYKEVQYHTGDFIEQYVYNKPLYKKNTKPLTPSIKKDANKNKKTKEEQEEYRSKLFEKKKVDIEGVKASLNRKKKEIRRTINTNCRKDNKSFCSFFTATYRENQTDEYKARSDFNKFIKRLQYNYPPVKAGNSKRVLSFENYIYCLERQERGAIHFHVIFFNCPFLHYTSFQKVWGFGTVDIHCIKKIHRVGSYICKYLTSSEKYHLDFPITGKTWCKSQTLLLYTRSDYFDYTSSGFNHRFVFQQSFQIKELNIDCIFTLFERIT